MLKRKPKKGAASFYVVIVCAILFSVITVGFVTLTVNEISKSSEFSLSESSEEAAKAGVEDAKLAIASCIDKTTGEWKGDNECNDLLNSNNDCEGSTEALSELMGATYDTENGVYINETGDSSETTTEAYTCVLIDPYKDDYLGTLSAENPIKIIPLQVYNNSSSLSNSSVEYVEISWYSVSNLGNDTASFKNVDNNGYPIFGDEISNPPVITASVYQTDNSEISRGTLWLVPSDKDDFYDNIQTNTNTNNIYATWSNYVHYDGKNQITTFDSDALKKAGDSNNTNTRVGMPVRCATNKDEATNGYLCKVKIQVPSTTTTRSNTRGRFLLVLSLPYQNPLTDFKVQMLDSGNGVLKFDKVQISVDSTGRANDIYSRVETRLEDTNTSISIPEYAMILSAESSSPALSKNFFITNHNDCWYANANATQAEIKQCGE